MTITATSGTFARRSRADLLRLFRSWQDLSPRDNEELLDEMARRGMTGLELLAEQADSDTATGVAGR
jgi:hypothetical protein